MNASVLPLVGAFALTLASTSAQQPVTDTLLVDIETGSPENPNSSTPVAVGEWGGALWFAATTRDEGRELWLTDGTRSGTRRITDLAAGLRSSNPIAITAPVAGKPMAPQSVLPNGKVLFAASADGLGIELWTIDLATQVPQLLRDIHPGPGDSAPRNGVFWQGEFWFLADDGQTGIELWRTDGTRAGTVLADDLAPGTASVLNGYENLIAASGKLWFRSTFGSNLWVKDAPGTPARIVTNVGRASAAWLHGGAAGGGLVFVNDDPVDGDEPWFSDGTAAGTRQLADLQPGRRGSEPYFLGSDGARVWFRADDGSHGYELFVSDGTPSGTRIVADLRPGPYGGMQSTIYALLDPVSGDLLFSASDGSTGLELYRSDGTTAGTRMVADVDPGSRSSFPSGLRLVGRAVLFNADTPSLGRELYAHDLQSGATLLLDDLWQGIGHSNPGVFGVAGQTILVAAYTGRGGIEPWTTQLQPGTARLLRDLFPGPTSRGSQPALLGRWRDKAFFGAWTEQHGTELWASDGTAAGTLRLTDIMPGIGSFDPVALGACEQGFVVTNRGGLGGFQLWISDGTPAGTTRLPHFEGSRQITGLYLGTAHHGKVYFGVREPSGYSTWVSDGTVAGTLALLAPSPTSFFNAAAGLGDRLTLGAGESSSATGTEPWVTDGTPAGTRSLGDLNPGSGSSFPVGYTEVGGGAVFSAFDAAHGRELWFTRGSPTSTVLVSDILPGSEGSDIRDLTSVGDRVVFLATTPTTGTELWVTDGTAAGTVMLADLVPGSADASLRYLRRAGESTAWFWADPNGTGDELWLTDGTPAGTFRVSAAPAAGQLYAPDATFAPGDGQHVVFAQESGPFGNELWTSDGTAMGTRPLTDSNRGPRPASPYGALRLGNRLLFTADDGEHGRELHLVELGAAGAWVASPFGEGCGTDLGSSGVPVLGSQFDLVSTSPPTTPTVFAFGAMPAWTDLAPGCALHLATPIAVAAAASDPSGRTVLNLPVPNQTALLGDLLHFQAFSLTAAGPLQGSNGLEVVIGR